MLQGRRKKKKRMRMKTEKTREKDYANGKKERKKGGGELEDKGETIKKKKRGKRKG